MRSSFQSAYFPSILFSAITQYDTLKINYSEQKMIKHGNYYKLMKSYYQTYNSDGTRRSAEITGTLFDTKI